MTNPTGKETKPLGYWRELLTRVRDAGAQDDNHGGEDWTHSDAVINAVEAEILLLEHKLWGMEIRLGSYISSEEQFTKQKRVDDYIATLQSQHEREVELPKLGKLMLVERFMSQYFTEIAESVALSPTGASKDIERLESGEAAGDNRVLEGWLESSMMKDWAALEPKLKDVDLRPYLFVSKDKKDYFGSSAALGNLLNIIERLMGPKLAVSGMKSELTALAPPEAAQMAFFQTIAELAEGTDVDLTNLNGDQVQTVVETYVTNAIELRLFNEVGLKGVTIPKDAAAATEVQQQLHDFVNNGVVDAMADLKDKASAMTPDRTREFVEQVYERSFDMLLILANQEEDSE